MILLAKEKAKELVDKMWIYALPNANGSWQNAKECALIAVNECLQTCVESMIYYWQEVKQEIEKL